MMDERRLSVEPPRGWSWTRLGQIAEVNPRFAPEDLSDDLEVSFLPMRCVEQLTGRIDLSITRRLLEVRKRYTSFAEGDILFAKITPCMENGKVAIARGLQSGIGFGSTEFHVIRLPKSLPRVFFFLFLIQAGLRRDARMRMTGSAGQLRVPTAYMREIEIPLPPLAEQRRIVAKIEELFSQLDAGVVALDQAKAQLVRYRQAVLKHAFEGKLTQAWREAHKDELEPASVLLERIKVEREKAAAGKRRSKPLPPLDTSELPELPEGWVWTQIRELATATEQPVLTGPFGTSLGRADFISTGVPLLTIGCLTHSGVTLAKARFVSEQKASQLARYALRPGDLLFSRMATIGRAGYVGESLEGALFNYHLMRLRLDATAIHPKYCLAYLQGDPSARDYIGKINHGATRGGVNTRQLLGMPVALAPMEEQLQILSEIEERLSVAEYLAGGLDESLRRAQRLRQSILKRAFEGKLVPQDPNDEPAEMLLERIKEEKVRREAEGKARGGRKRGRVRA